MLVFSVEKTIKPRDHHKKAKTIDHTIPELVSNQQLIYDEEMKEFESKCQGLKHFCCQNCQMTGISIKQSQRNGSICTTCQALHASKEEMEKDLPVWYDKEDIVHYDLPPELECLQEGEKLLIQQVAAYVPLLHLKDGQIGSRGHVCSFVQDISHVLY